MLFKKNTFFVNAFSNWATLGVEAILAFILTPVIIHNLGQSGYGIWVIIGSIIGYYGFLDLGVASAVMRYVARFSGEGTEREVKKIVSTAFAFFITIGISIVGGTFLLSDVLAKLIDVPQQGLENFSLAIEILALSMAIRFAISVFKITLIAHEMFIITNIVVTTSNLIRASLTFSFLYYGWGLLGVALSHLITVLLTEGVYVICCFRYISKFRIEIKSIDKGVLYKLVSFGGITTVIAITDTIRLNVDSVVIAKFVDMSAVGVFAVASLLVRYFVRLVVSAMGVITPRFAKLDMLGEKKELSLLFLRALFVCSLMAFSLAAILVVYGGDFLLLWVGHDFEASIQILIILTVGHAVAVSQNVGIGLMYALKKHHWYAVTSSFEAVLNLCLSIVLVTRYGIIGVALGTALPMLLIRGFIQPFYVSKTLGLSVVIYYAYLILGLVIGGAVVFSMAYIGSKIFLEVNYINLGVQVILTIIAVMACFILVRKIELKYRDWGNKIIIGKNI